MGELLLGLLEILLEALVDFLIVLIPEFYNMSVNELFSPQTEKKALLPFFGYLCIGLATGGISLLIFPRAIFYHSDFHGVGLVLIPIVTGLAMKLLGTLKSRFNWKQTRLDTFIYSFIFSFGITLIRFIFSRHP